jgi:DICT domain-containing protein
VSDYDDFVDYVVNGPDTELAKTKAELAYALHALEREIAIAQQAQAHLASARKALECVEQYGSDTLSGRADGIDDREWQRGAVIEMRNRARDALLSLTDEEGKQK